MYGSWTENVALLKVFFRIHLRHIKILMMYKSPFKIIHLGGYVLRIDFVLIIKLRRQEM